jgi:hypothetical protein
MGTFVGGVKIEYRDQGSGFRGQDSVVWDLSSGLRNQGSIGRNQFFVVISQEKKGGYAKLMLFLANLRPALSLLFIHKTNSTYGFFHLANDYGYR